MTNETSHSEGGQPSSTSPNKEIDMNICKHCFDNGSCVALKKQGTMQACSVFRGDNVKVKREFILRRLARGTGKLF